MRPSGGICGPGPAIRQRARCPRLQQLWAGIIFLHRMGPAPFKIIKTPTQTSTIQFQPTRYLEMTRIRTPRRCSTARDGRHESSPFKAWDKFIGFFFLQELNFLRSVFAPCFKSCKSVRRRCDSSSSSITWVQGSHGFFKDHVGWNLRGFFGLDEVY